MALVFCDGFDYYNTSAYFNQIWDSNPNSLAPNALSTGRFGTSRSFTNTSGGVGPYKTVAAQATYIVALAIKFNVVSTAVKFLSFQDGANVHVQVGLDSTGHLAVYRNGTLLGSAAVTPLLANTWYHVQAKVLIDDTVGTYEVRVDGITGASNGVGAATGADTRNAGTAQITRIAVVDGAGGVTPIIDDVIILDTTGSLNNNFPGDCKISTVFPSAAGNSAQFTPSAGANWQNVDDNPSNDDTDYNSDATVGHKDTHACTDVTVTGAILGVKHSITFRKDDAGARQVCGVCRSGVTDFDGTTRTCGSSFAVNSDMYETDPNTSAAWAGAAFNSAEFGYKVVA